MQRELILAVIFVGLVSLSGCVETEEPAILPEELEKDATACNADSDCKVVFLHCPEEGNFCSNVCRNTYAELVDCTPPCFEEQSDYSVQSCACVKNKCVAGGESALVGEVIRTIAEGYEELNPPYESEGENESKDNEGS